MINIVANKLTDAVFKGFGNNFQQLDFGDADTDMLMHLHNNVYQFSSAKNYSQLKEMNTALFDDKGKIIPFNDFKKKAEEIDKVYNVNFLKTEYNFAINSSYSAARWADFEKNADQMPFLQYWTAGDSRVRESHQVLDGVIRRIDDPFWDTYYTPNGWGCRCTVTQLAGEAEETNLENINLPEVPKMFRTNLAKQRLVFPPDSNYYVDIPDNINDIAKKVQQTEIKKWAKKNIMSKSVQNYILDGKTQIPIDIIINKDSINKWMYCCFFSDISNSTYYLLDIIKKAKPLGSSRNEKPNKKQWANKYHYYSIKILGKDYYISICENKNGMFYLYSIGDKKHK